MTPHYASPSSSNHSTEGRQLWIYHGNQEAEIYNAKLSLLKTLIPDSEERRQNTTEILPPHNRPLTLKDAYSSILTELGQQSLFGDARQVVVTYQLQELFKSWGGRTSRRSTKALKTKKGRSDPKQDRLESFLEALKERLETTQNAILFIAVEDDSKNRRVDEKGSFFRRLASLGEARKFASKAFRFELTDAVLARSVPRAMEVVKKWRAEDSRAAGAIYRVLLDDVHCLIQAAIFQRESSKTSADPTYQRLLFPSDLKPNLLTLHEFRQKKYRNAVIHYTDMNHLMLALEGLLEIQRALFPKGDETYIPDVNYLIDIFIARFLASSHFK